MMLSTTLILLLCWWVTLATSTATNGNCSVTPQEYEALHGIYNSTGGDGWQYYLSFNEYNGYAWNFTTYNLSAPCSNTHHWQGLACTNCQIRQLTMYLMNLVGTLPESIGNLTYLQILILSQNFNLVGSIPNSITQLSDLERVTITSNSMMKGPIPTDIGQLSKLTSLGLEACGLTGTIPPSLFNLTQLFYLDLSANRLVGNISSDVVKLTRLNTLNLGSNLLSGSISQDFIHMKSLKQLYLYDNHLTSTIPNIAWNTMTNLTSLEVASNYLTGPIPSSIWASPSLQYFTASGNRLNGSLPDSYTFLSAILELELSSNQFTGTIPSGLGELATLQFLDLGTNHFHGTIPANLTNLENLNTLYVNLNELTGTIPAGVYKFPMQILNFMDNFFHGTVPNSICTNKYLSVFQIANNSFSGTIPSCIFYDCSTMDSFIVGENFLNGTLPTRANQTWTWTYLNTFQVNNNLLEGNIPPDIFNTLYLSILYLNDNKFSGSIPPINQVSTLSMSSMSLANNRLTGKLPADMTRCTYLQLLDLSDNFLEGPVNFQLKQMLYLNSMDVSGNLFTGHFPSFTTFGSLANAYIFNNFFTGHVLFNSYQRTVMVNMILDNNLFTGNLSRVGMLTHMVECSMMNNLLTGALPKFSSAYLKYVYVGGNLLSGSIGDSLLSLPILSALQLQNNALTGNIDGILSLQLQNQTSVIDLSSNFFTGSIPFMFFQFPQLSYFAAVSNCLTASIPDSICMLNQTLNTLALDGLHTASSCQRRIFPSAPSDSTAIKTYTLPSQVIVGTLPSCLFTAMTNLTTLHLSGNGMKGTLPNDVLSIERSLKQLSLSNNIFTGTIPSAFQQHAWDQLDLSFNRFTGVLEPSFSASFDRDNTSLKLNLNRLSGNIPASLIYVQNIKILTGNMFSCSHQRDDLPSNDHDSSSYECGSDAVNTSMIVYGCGLLIVAAAALLHMRWVWKTSMLSMLSLFVSSCVVNQTPPAVLDAYPHIKQLHSFLHKLRLWMVSTSVFMVILVFVYLALSAFYSTYTYDYAWQVSAAFLSGIVPALLLLVLYLVLFLLMFLSDRNVFAIRNLITASSPAAAVDSPTSPTSTGEGTLSNMSIVEQHPRGDDRIRTRSHFASLDIESDGAPHTHEAAACCGGWTTCGTTSYCDWFTARLALESTVNISIVVVINAVYIYLYISQISIEERTALTIAMSVFKESWRQFLTLQMKWKIDYLVHLQALSAPNTAVDAAVAHPASSSWKPSSIFVLFTFLCLFNNIIAPLLATAFINPNCYYYAVVSQDPITSTSTVPFCFSTTNNTFVPCANTAELTLSTTYDPAFSYNFLCSSSLLSTFANVWMYLFLYTGLMLPLAKFAAMEFLRGMDVPEKSSSMLTHMQLYVPLTFLNKASLISRLKTESPEDHDLIVFSARKFVMILVTNVAVFLCFGMVFPPIAIVGCISVLVQCYLEQHLLQRLIRFTQREEHETTEEELGPSEAREELKVDDAAVGIALLAKVADRQCQGVSHSVIHNLQELKWLVAIFWSLFLMDIIGDQVGWKGAIWIVVLLVALCIAIQLWEFHAAKKRSTSPKEAEGSIVRSVSSFISSTCISSDHKEEELRSSELTTLPQHSSISSLFYTDAELPQRSDSKVEWNDLRSSEIITEVMNPIK